MPITRMSAELEHRSSRTVQQEPSKVAGINDKRRVETDGGGGGGPALPGTTTGRRATQAYAASKRGTTSRPVVLARQVMTSPVQTVSSTESIARVQAFQKTTGLKNLPVIDGQGKLVGMLTDRDLLRGYRLGGADSLPLPSHSSVAQLMQRLVVAATSDTELRDIAQAMVTEGVRCVPVVDGENLCGIITATDILKCVVATGTLDGWL